MKNCNALIIITFLITPTLGLVGDSIIKEECLDPINKFNPAIFLHPSKVMRHDLDFHMSYVLVLFLSSITRGEEGVVRFVDSHVLMITTV